jgi:saxitoxin biosynthesis operon SxtJ-like protein
MKKVALHEELQRELEVQGSSDRVFGLTIAGFLVLVGLWPLARGGAPRPWALGVAVVLLGLALLAPTTLGPLNRGWMRLGLLLQRVTNPVFLGFLFYLVVTPTGLLMRLLGKTPLRLRLDRAAPTYWIDRRPPGPAGDTMRNQF